MKNYKMVIAYDGTRYDGWQKQGNTEKTIQGKLELILEKMVGQPVEVHGSGRTDAGVHSKGQVANFHIDTKLSCEEIQNYLNMYLPKDIGVLSVTEVPERFHSRLHAVGKTYEYCIITSKVPHVFERNYVYFYEKPLDVYAMRQASLSLIGEHDFLGFCSLKKMKKSSIRTITSIEIEEIQMQGVQDEIRITVTGNGFLYNMVRIIVGTLIEIGAGNKKSEDIETILKTKNRQLAGMTAPASGLSLKEVYYE